jgi:methylated-DNA-protein-cysteine methyltransferase-like protein
MNPIRSKNTLRALGVSNGTRTFSERVLKAALAIPKGKVTTYGAITRACGAGPMASQSITTILGKAYDAGEKRIPWHRIVYAGGKVWIDDKHRKERMALYKKEGIDVDPKTGKIKNFEEVLFEFK